MDLSITDKLQSHLKGRLFLRSLEQIREQAYVSKKRSFPACGKPTPPWPFVLTGGSNTPFTTRSTKQDPTF